ncbi:hypothetical protein [Mycolicibacterium sp. PDY-3]|uniref:hypothetical protein n=1 Tax=Mycolicibacterium sp. PDY-3 TaxID=3376069 RepID=UPI0037AE44F9
MSKKFKRLPPAYPPAISEAMRQLIERESKAIEDGDTLGLDKDRTYLGVRVMGAKGPEWVVAPSPFTPASFEGMTVLFVASVTLAQAVHLVREGAAVHGLD